MTAAPEPDAPSSTLLLCIRPHPESTRLVRAGYRAATRAGSHWIVASVESTSQPALSERDRQSLSDALKLAENLGAETALLTGDDVSETLLAYARERSVGRILVGKPTHSRWIDRVRGSLLDDLVRRSGDVDVQFVAGAGAGSAATARTAAGRRSPLAAYLASAATIALCTVLCAAVFRFVDHANLVLVYLLGTAFVATSMGRGPSVLAAILSVACLDFFFVQPHLTFAVADPDHVLTFAVMLTVSLLISTLAVRLREHAATAHDRAEHARRLYAFSREVAGVHSADTIAEITSRHVESILEGPTRVSLQGVSELEAGVQGTARGPRKAGGAGVRPAEADARCLDVPLHSGDRTVGLMSVESDALLSLSPEQDALLEALAQQAAGALERARLRQEGDTARIAVERERMRSTLLSSVSHDFRTPLAAITGAVTCLLDQGSSDAAQRDLLETIHEEADRLDRLVTKLLDITRLESGPPQLASDWHSVEEVVGSTLARVQRRLGRRTVRVQIPKDLTLVWIDAALVEQLLVNVMENAIDHTAAEGTIEISAGPRDGGVTVTVADDGTGISAGSEERIFEKFYRAGAADGRGFGLGLAICRAIAVLHGQRIWAERGELRGTILRFTLPADGHRP